jgi:HD-like signal output (HDOD) protein
MNEFFQILDEANSSKRSLVDIEQEFLGYDHTDIGCALADDWNFPPDLSAAIGNHHSVETMEEKCSKVAATLFIADHLCHKEGIGYSYAASQDLDAFDAARAMLLEEYKTEVKDEALEKIMGEVLDKIAQMESAGWF